MQRFIVHSITTQSALALAFEVHGERLICIGEADGIPDIIVQAFDPARDIFYRTPSPLTPEELEEESHIYVPKSLREQIDRRVLASTLGSSVLIQFVERLAPALSPLSAMRIVLEPLGSVNAALIETSNGGLCYVHRVGEVMDAHCSSHSLKDFLSLPPESREEVFPGFVASSVIFSGSDLDHFERHNLGEFVEARRISLADFAPLCDLTEIAARLVGENPYLYTLAIGAASVYATILRETTTPRPLPSTSSGQALPKEGE